MKTEDKLNIQANRLLGEFIGTLEGVCLWEIPEELKLKLQSQLTALREIKIISSNLPVIKSVCRCKEGKQGRTVDENWEQICDVCGGS